MIKIKEKFFDRFDQTFKLLKNNLIGISILMFIYNILFVILFDVFLGGFISSNIGKIESFENFNIGLFLADPYVVLIITIVLLVFILYAISFIIVFLGTLRSIKQVIKGDNITIKENLYYGFLNFYNSMGTYWYIFKYVHLIPLSIFIIGGVMYVIGLSLNIGIFNILALLISIFGLFLFLYFSIYRGYKVVFAFYSAVDQDSFSAINFEDSKNITDNIWLRVFGNVFLIGILVSFAISIINSTLSTILFSISGGRGSFFEGFKNSVSSNNPDILKEMILNHIDQKSSFYSIIGSVINVIIKTLGNIFIIVFTYLFYIRLFGEKEYFKN